jgi:hypothetical protein
MIIPSYIFIDTRRNEHFFLSSLALWDVSLRITTQVLLGVWKEIEDLSSFYLLSSVIRMTDTPASFETTQDYNRVMEDHREVR